MFLVNYRGLSIKPSASGTHLVCVGPRNLQSACKAVLFFRGRSQEQSEDETVRRCPKSAGLLLYLAANE